MSKTTETIQDLTEQISFSEVDARTAEALLATRIVVIKNNISPGVLDGVRVAYLASRRHDIPRRAAGRAIRAVGLGNTNLYERTRVSDIACDPQAVPRHLRAVQPTLDALGDLNTQLFDQTAIRHIYGRRNLNLAFLFITPASGPAIGEHQDSQGATGLAYAPQLQPTLWHTHTLVPDNPYPPAPIAGTFRTEPGDVVVLTQRQGDCPSSIPFRQGTAQYFQDGSIIHSGENLTGEPRYGLGAFHQEVREVF